MVILQIASQMDHWVEKLSAEDLSVSNREEVSFYEQQLRLHNDNVQRLQHTVYQVIQRGQELHQVWMIWITNLIKVKQRVNIGFIFLDVGAIRGNAHGK